MPAALPHASGKNVSRTRCPVSSGFAACTRRANGRGTRTRLLRFAPGVFTTAPFVHDYWEEVYLVSGDLTVGNDAEGRGGTSFPANTYACRPPGAAHGPFRSERGCVLFEIHYYDPV